MLEELHSHRFVGGVDGRSRRALEMIVFFGPRRRGSEKGFFSCGSISSMKAAGTNRDDATNSPLRPPSAAGSRRCHVEKAAFARAGSALLAERHGRGVQRPTQEWLLRLRPR